MEKIELAPLTKEGVVVKKRLLDSIRVKDAKSGQEEAMDWALRSKLARDRVCRQAEIASVAIYPPWKLANLEHTELSMLGLQKPTPQSAHAYRLAALKVLAESFPTIFDKVVRDFEEVPADDPFRHRNFLDMQYNQTFYKLTFGEHSTRPLHPWELVHGAIPLGRQPQSPVRRNTESKIRQHRFSPVELGRHVYRFDFPVGTFYDSVSKAQAPIAEFCPASYEDIHVNKFDIANGLWKSVGYHHTEGTDRLFPDRGGGGFYFQTLDSGPLVALHARVKEGAALADGFETAALENDDQGMRKALSDFSRLVQASLAS